MRIEAHEGMWITQKEDIPIDRRICTKYIYISERARDKWQEITDARKQEYEQEYAEWLREHEDSEN